MVGMFSAMWNGKRRLRQFGDLLCRIDGSRGSYGPSEGLRPPQDDIIVGGERSRWRLAIGLLTLLCLAASSSQLCRAQESSDQSWTANNQQSDPNGALNPIRSHTTHSDVGGHVVDKTIVERLGPDGRYVPYSEIERESVRVNDTTVRTVERSYGRDADGQRTLTQQTQEESRSSSDGSKQVTRMTSNPDANGGLQVVQRTEVDSKVVSPGVRDTKTTVFSANGSGGLGATMQVEERERRVDPATTESTKSTALADGAGHWTVSEVRQGTTRQDADGMTKEERVLRPDSNGQMAVVERTVSKEPAGGQSGTTETYSTNVPGQAGDEGLQLVRRESTAQQTGASGERRTTRQVKQTNPGDPAAGVRVTQEAIDIVRPGANGVDEKQSTVVTTDANGQMSAVWVDMGSSDKPEAVKVDTKAATKNK